MNRKEYLGGKISHRDYYGSIVNECGISFSKDDGIVLLAKKSNDKHYNNIPLGIWDAMAINNREMLSVAFRKHGDSYSLAGGVCVYKEAVRQATERRGGTE